MTGSEGLHRLVGRQAALTPDAVAISCGSRSVTYAELTGRAGRWAGALRERGVGPETPVGVCLPRQPELVVGLLAVLAAGGCALPLDPAFPPARRAAMVADAGAVLLLTDLGPEPAGPGPAVVAPGELDGTPGPGRLPAVPADQVAYLIYTSGSTGRPKGVAIEHRSAVQLMGWARSTFSADELSGVLAGTSVCFDLSVFELFAPLCWGGRVVLVEDVLRLGTLSPAAGVRLVNTVPSAMSELVAAGAVPAGVRTVCLAGEPLTAALVERLRGLPDQPRVLNLYGPSEDTTYSTWSELISGDGRRPPIGRPLPGTAAYLLDGDLRPVRTGVTGELALAGGGLARGYLGRPAETADRFRPDPLDPRPGRRMYRTGDRALRRPDGQLEFVGRTDDQVKIRGHRVELGEVEAALAALPQVRQAAAGVAVGPTGDRRLVGYLVAAPGTAPATGPLLAALRTAVPSHLVPATLVWLDRLPRTPTGKTDRRRLPAPDWAAASTPAGTGVAAAVRAAWRAVLGVDADPDDDFLALGGDSLSAVSAVARLRDTLGRPVPLDAVLRHRTPRALTAALLAPEPSGPSGPSEPSEPSGPDGSGADRRVGAGRGPLLPGQRGLWLRAQLDPTDTAYLIRVLVEVRSEADPDVLEQAVRDLVRSHEALRTGFPDGEPIAVVPPPGAVQVACSRLTDGVAEAEQLDRLSAADAVAPLPADRPPLTRWRLVLRGNRPVAVLLTAHHLVLDAWSVEVLVRDLGRWYDHRAAGGPAPATPPSPLLLAAERGRWLAGPAGRAATRDLLDSLSPPPPVLRLPADRPDPAGRSAAGAHLLAPVDPATAAAVTAAARRHGTTAYVVGLAAFADLLADWTGGCDLLLATAAAGRTSVSAEQCVGCFANTVPVRLRTDPTGSVRDRLAAADRAALIALAGQDVPLDHVLELTGPAVSAPRVAFGLIADRSADYDGLRLRLHGREAEPDRARFDLTLWLRARPDGLAALWTYRGELLGAGTVRTLHDRYVRALAELSVDPAAGRRPEILEAR